VETNTYTNNVNNDVVSTTFPTQKIKHLFDEVKYSDFEIGDFDVLSLTQRGILSRDLSTNEGQIAESYDNYIKVEVGDISLNPMDLLTGWVDINNKEGLMSPAYYTLRNKSSKVLSIEFAIYFFQTCYRQRIFFKIGKGVATHDGAGRWTLTRDNLMNFKFPVPEIHEQNLISKYLDGKTTQIDSLIEKIERKIELLEEQRTALINQAVTKGLDPNVEMKDSGVEWIGKIPTGQKIGKLKYILEYQKGWPFKSDEFVDQGIPIVTASNIKRLTIIESTKCIGETTAELFKQVKLTTGDLIISTVGSKMAISNSAVGQIALVPPEFDGSLLNQNTVRLRLKIQNIVSMNYLFYVCQGKAFRSHLDIFAHGTANQASLNVEDLLSFSFFYPSLESQQHVVEFLDVNTNRLDGTIDLETKRIELLKEYRQSLISNVVTGKVRVVEDVA